MKVVIATCGTRGDVQPLIALARALNGRGHQTRLAAPPEHEAWVKSCGCAFQALGSDFSAMLRDYTQVHTLKPLIGFLGFMRREIRKQLSQLPGIIEGADLVLGASLCLGLHTVAESRGIPYGFVATAPQILPSDHHPFVAVPFQNLPSWLNRFSWEIARLLDRLNFTALLNKERRHLNLAPVKDSLRYHLGRHVLVASDPAIAEVPSDVILDCCQTGYLHLEMDRALSPKVESFLAEGSPPVYFGFGSMSTRRQEDLVVLIQTSLEITGLRGIITGFRFDGTGFRDSKKWIFIREVPHRALFLRVAAVVHHGGAGTTAAAALAGAPQVIVPHILDPFYWGESVYRCGLGPPPVWRSRLTGERLAVAIIKCVAQKNHYDRAASVAEEIKQMDSRQLAVDYIESTFISS